MKEYYKYLCEYWNGTQWVKEVFIYAVPPESVDLKTDWRFCEVPGKRKQLIPILKTELK